MRKCRFVVERSTPTHENLPLRIEFVVQAENENHKFINWKQSNHKSHKNSINTGDSPILNYFYSLTSRQSILIEQSSNLNNQSYSKS